MAVTVYTPAKARKVLWRLIIGASAVAGTLMAAAFILAVTSGFVRVRAQEAVIAPYGSTIILRPYRQPDARVIQLPGYMPRDDGYPTIEERDRMWVERCDIKLAWGEHGVRRYTNNGKPGCANGQWSD